MRPAGHVDGIRKPMANPRQQNDERPHGREEGPSRQRANQTRPPVVWREGQREEAPRPANEPFIPRLNLGDPFALRTRIMAAVQRTQVAEVAFFQRWSFLENEDHRARLMAAMRRILAEGRPIPLEQVFQSRARPPPTQWPRSLPHMDELVLLPPPLPWRRSSEHLETPYGYYYSSILLAARRAPASKRCPKNLLAPRFRGRARASWVNAAGHL